MTDCSLESRAPITVALPTLGCKANRYDSDTLARALAARGYQIVAPHASADVYVINTCTVTGDADAKSRKALRRAQRLNPLAKLIVTGCSAAFAPEKLLAITGIDAVVSISEQPRIPDIITALLPPVVSPNSAPPGLVTSIARTRATVKIQDGCNRRCAYCAVTLARGEVRSRALDEVIAELRALVAAGIPEIVLTGIRLDAYGLDRDYRLADLLDATRALAIPRLRLSSLEPIGIDDRLVRSLTAHPTLCHHFHLCLQSGDDEVLHAMRRGYTADDYRRTLGALRTAMPEATFTTDVIVGFPGESDAAFARTCALVEEIGFIQLHIFKFSPRPGTAAATMQPQVADAVKDTRSQTLFALERRLFRQYATSWLGRDVSVLVERAGRQRYGLTPHYVRVCAPFPPAATGTLQTVRITDIAEDHLLGTLIA
ncbi:MAG TPA: tRNA (N(6)-L-threonylcarbamoyladenosine(37)-C(2))-methylthiotransferase MtaB [Armatimonadota bacterium]|jgi:threonylcarbamoyladenosine tRNA methylthiotransferase MtaB